MRAAGIPDSTPFHPGYIVFMLKCAPRVHERSRDKPNSERAVENEHIVEDCNLTGWEPAFSLP